MIALSLSLYLLATTPTENPAREVVSGVVVDTKGQAVTLTPGDCYVPKTRCVEYVTDCEKMRAEHQELKNSTVPVNAWLVVAVAVVAFGAGASTAWLVTR